ncbi:D-aminoacyl-tRNA deacylase [Haloarchaeobius iranensis]|uniref:D-aminoacyl-tRNA deacylase n=1 Tax=Haloarchaeobius iranensis TaxID=996166 RepID=A0A1G9TCF8_9EURY|nr:D-aminoacyl-tRNA deacylase [Haloarchaeobius iranensis]SDM45347.1 D-aminoacyl-tRNA deacylase [Haloarchaeobius iranensis]
MIGIVVSRADSASEHIGEHLLGLADWDATVDDGRRDAVGGGTVHRTDGFELRTFDELHLHLDGVAAAFDDPDLVLFASRHSGDTGPLLTAHFTGNFGPAEYGGDDDALAAACPNAQAALLSAFDRHAPDGYEVGMECTHHGPSDVGVPSMFVELGSDEAEWADPAGARAVARAILDVEGVDPTRERSVVGFGGGHYVPRFERVVRETDWAVGHVAGDWSLDAMGHPEEHREVVDRAFTASGASLALVEGEQPQLVETIADLGYRVVSETWLREVDGRDLDRVAALEDALVRVDDGLRFGARFAVEEWSVRTLPEDLFAAAQAIDRETTYDLVASRAVALETENAGSRVGDRAAFPPGGFDALVDDLCAVLAEKYETVRREDGAVVAEERAFDPALAHEAGVPEGPKFGELAGGQPVEVEGRTVEPAAVRTERTDRFELG